MKFEIRKSSNWHEKPCDEAMEETRPNLDVRRVDSPYRIWHTEEEVQKEWYQHGTNHRSENGRILRNLPDTMYWTIEFQSLEELMAFQETYGEILISDIGTSTDLKLLELKNQ